MIIGVINQLSYPGGRTLSVVVANKKPGLLGDSHIYIYIWWYGWYGKDQIQLNRCALVSRASNYCWTPAMAAMCLFLSEGSHGFAETWHHGISRATQHGFFQVDRAPLCSSMTSKVHFFYWHHLDICEKLRFGGPVIFIDVCTNVSQLWYPCIFHVLYVLTFYSSDGLDLKIHTPSCIPGNLPSTVASFNI